MLYPLSYLQKRLWFFSYLGEDSSYNSNTSLDFYGPIDPEVISAVFETIISRHEALRTTFVEVNGEPMQKINSYEEIGFKCDFIDLKHQTAEEVRHFVHQSFERKFDLVKGPLLQVKVLQLEEQRFAMLVSLHHIISDGWSKQLLGKEFYVLYDAYSRKQPNPLSPLRFHQKDFIAKYYSDSASAEMELKRNYWLKEFEGEMPVLQLPTDFVRPVEKTNNGRMLSLNITPVELDFLQKFGQHNNVSLFVTLVSALKVLFQRYSGQRDIVFGIPIGGRFDSDMELVVGCFINTLALRTKIGDGDSFRTLIKNVSKKLFSGYENNLYPFDKLISELKVKRDTSRSPVFDITVNYMDHIGIEYKKLDDIDIRSFENNFVKSKFDIEVDFVLQDTGVTVNFTYNTDLFKEERIQKMSTDYRNILFSLINSCDYPLNYVDFMTDEERRLLLESFNGVSVSPSTNDFYGLFKDVATQFGKEDAVVFGNTKLSYQVLEEKSNQVANFLTNSLSVKHGDTVALLLEPSEFYILLILGIYKAGACFVPFNSKYPVARVMEILSDDEIDFCVTGQTVSEIPVSSGPVCIAPETIKSGMTQYSKQLEQEFQKDLDTLAYIIYTSGSTGKPKGVEVGQRSLINYLIWANKYYYANQRGYTTALFTSLSSDLTITSLLAPLLRGDTIYVYNNEVQVSLKEIFEADSPIRTVKLTPSHIYAMELLEIDSTQIKVMIVGGEELTEKHVSYLNKIGPDMLIFNEYGPTEATVGCTVELVDGNRSGRSIGRPIDNAYIYILNDDLFLQPIGIIGRIYVSGACLAKGYRLNPALTRDKFIFNPYSETYETMYDTGDLGRWNADGNLEYYGRTDEQVKIRGYRVELCEIEAIICKFNNVERALVMLKEDDGSKFLVGYLSGITEQSISELRKFLVSKLPEYMIPQLLIPIEKFTLATSGKVDKSVLPGTLNYIKTTDKMEEVNGDLEKGVLEIWKKVLNLKEIGATDNFFQSGGDSLLIIVLFKALSDAYGKLLTVVDLFKYNTIRGQSEIIQERLGVGSHNVIETTEV